MKTLVALIVTLGFAIAVAARMKRFPAPPVRPEGSWEPAGSNPQ